MPPINITGIENILTQINGLQESEKELIAQLETASNMPNSALKSSSIQNLLRQINNISEARESLFNSVTGMMSVLQNGVSESSVSLVGQMTLLKVVEDQLNTVKSQMSSLQNRNDTKMRLVEINTYYGKRYEYQTELMKKIIIVCIPLIIMFVLKKKGIIPELISNYLLGITIAIGSIFILRDVWEIHIRSNMNFDEYDWKYEDPNNYAPGIWEYNKKNLLKIENPFKNLLKNLGICIGDACCSDGLFFDKKKQKCIVPNSITTSTTNTNTDTDTTNETFITSNNSLGLNATVVADYQTDEVFENGIVPYYVNPSFTSIS
jgi:hypothetical protein